MSAIILERWENPGGVGNRTSSITVTTTAAFTVTGPITNLIDGAYGQNYTDSVEITGGQSSKEIKFDFGSGNAKKILAVTWRKNPNQSHGTWKLAGSNDDATYFDVIPAFSTTFIFAKGVSNGVNDGFYRYYKLIQTSGTTSGTPWNQEIEFRLSDSAGADIRSMIAPSYANFLGTGDRRAWIDVGGTITWANQTDIIDGTVTGSAFMTNGQTSRYISFDFTEDILITEFIWKQDNSASQGTWKWQGDSGGGTYVDLTSAFTLGGATTTTVTALSGITDYYSKYRLTQVSGSTSSSPFILEVEFKVGQPAIVSASAPVITSVAPATGLFSGGTPVTITGTLLTGTTDVQFDTDSATSIVVVDDFTITCVSPAHAVGLVDVKIFNPAGDYTKTGAFTFIDPAARITQAPLLVIALGTEVARITQAPLLVLYQPEEPTRVTQAPLLALYNTKPVPLPKPVIPETPMYESWIWNTVLSEAQQGQEQRGRLREVPRYKLDFSALILDEADRVSIYGMLMRYLKQTFLYPMFQYNIIVSQTALAGDTKLFCDTAFTDVRNGEFIALYDPRLETITYLTCTTVDSDGVNLSAPLEFDVPMNWQICPAFNFHFSPTVGLNMRNIDGDLGLVMESTNPRVFQRPGAAPTLTTIDGILIIPERYLTNDKVTEGFTLGIEWFDNGTSIPDNLNEWGNPRTNSERKYSFIRRDKIDYWRAVCDTMKGRQNVALFPTFRDDIPLREAMVLNAVTFTTYNTNLFIWYLDTNYRYLRIATANGPKYRRMISVDPHYDVNGEPDYLTVTLASSTGNTAGDNVISAVSYMNLCRFASDEVRLTHDSVDSEIEFAIKAVDK